MWHAIVGDELLIFEGEETNEHDQNAISVFDEYISKVAGHVPFN